MWTCCGRGEDEAGCGLSPAGRSRWRSMLAELKRRTPDTLERVNAEFEARVKAIRIDDGSHVGTKLVTVGAAAENGSSSVQARRRRLTPHVM